MVRSKAKTGYGQIGWQRTGREISLPPPEGGEIDQDIRPLGRSQEEVVLLDIADRDALGVAVVADRDVGPDDRSRQKAAFGADLSDRRAELGGIGDASGPAIQNIARLAWYNCRLSIRSLASLRMRSR
jgi:hypothetical protein